LRADSTPQVARIDAHLLNRQGVARLCYCGPVVHTRTDRPFASREPLQFGAEIYGHAGQEADLEIDRTGAGLPAQCGRERACSSTWPMCA
jgi:ATP phosphoribosyltransferase regulatory subunit